jgi:oligoribonuclease NrnB/cAMP/cGMP phosphodiesterase (DHH superfamily)
MKIACIYHSRDLDGWMSAAIVKKWFEDTNHTKDGDTLNFIGWDYGNEIPDTTMYDKVVMCDISFPKEVMYELRTKLGSNFVWIDHHISAINDNKETILSLDINGVRDISYAACELTWIYFFTNTTMPEIVRLLGRYDCFGYKQQWKPVIGYEGIYEVSNQGSVRSIDRVVTEINTNKIKNINGKELSIVTSNRGYSVVNLFKNNKGVLKNVHQLVAEAFIPNPDNKVTVNHKDSNRLNNHVTNLEWNTYAENNDHAIENGDRGYPVIQRSKDGKYITTFDSIRIAEKETGISNQNISSVCKGKRESAGGFKWEYTTRKETPQFIPENEERKVLEFQYGARSCIGSYTDAYVALVNSLDSTYITDNIHNIGIGIYTYLCTEASQIYAKKFTLNLGYRFACVNRERFNPINFGIDYHADGYDGFACFWLGADGKWEFSLYNDNGVVDCSAIAKSFGGGGHKGAAGFKASNINEFLLNHKI